MKRCEPTISTDLLGRQSLIKNSYDICKRAKCSFKIDDILGLRPKSDDELHSRLYEESLPPWVFYTRYSERPITSGSRTRKNKQRTFYTKRPRTAFDITQLERLKDEFASNPYLTSERRTLLANELNLMEVQIKIWFQNKRAKIKKNISKVE